MAAACGVGPCKYAHEHIAILIGITALQALRSVPCVKLPLFTTAELLTIGGSEGGKDREVGRDKIECNHMTSTFSTAVTARPAGGKSDSYSMNSTAVLTHHFKSCLCLYVAVCASVCLGCTGCDSKCPSGIINLNQHEWACTWQHMC